ncbi:MDR family MFS transporter [Aspergillus foveolatus]|uniref:MDR family MFS transporter n=1 Tax=Aspergillus foveolatus TaxID=210207 RepID=UPI003CCDB0B5
MSSVVDTRSLRPPYNQDDGLTVSNAVAEADARIVSTSRSPTQLLEPSSSTQHAESNIATPTSTAQLLPNSADKHLELDRSHKSSDTGPGPGPGPSAGQEAQEAAPEEWISGVPLLLVNTGVTLVIFLMLLDTSIVSTAVPKITNQFHSLGDVAWYGSAYTLASCALQPLTGKFYTHFKSKIVFLTFFGIFELGSIICGVANSSIALIIGRAVSGMGTSGLINGALTIIAGVAPIHKRPTLIGIMMGVSQLGLVLGPLVGGSFTTYTTWRWCFYINLPIGGLVAILLFFTRVPEQRRKPPALSVLPTLHKTLDLVGFVLFAPAAIMFLLALEYGGNEYPWSSSRVIGLFVGAGATALVFLGWEYRKGKEAMIPFHLLTIRIAYTSYIATGVMFGLTMAIAYYVPIYFQAVRDDSALMSGVNFLPYVLGQLVAAVITGVLIGRLGYYLPFAIVGAILSAVGSGLFSLLSPTTSTVAWAAYQIVLGFGRGASTQPTLLAVQNGVAPDDLSTAMAILIFSQTFGGSVFLAVASVIFSEGLKSQIPRYAPGVNPQQIIAAGATGFRDIIGGRSERSA